MSFDKPERLEGQAPRHANGCCSSALASERRDVGLLARSIDTGRDETRVHEAAAVQLGVGYLRSSLLDGRAFNQLLSFADSGTVADLLMPQYVQCFFRSAGLREGILSVKPHSPNGLSGSLNKA